MIPVAARAIDVLGRIQVLLEGIRPNRIPDKLPDFKNGANSWLNPAEMTGPKSHLSEILEIVLSFDCDSRLKNAKT